LAGIAAAIQSSSGVGEMTEFLQKIKDSFRSAIEFIKDTRKELNNVSWPPRHELTGTTLVVIVAVFFFGFFLYFVDIVVNSGMNLIFRQAGR
jgi:preprotein translocase SecE subunit